MRRRGFDVTDSSLDAPDGALLFIPNRGWYERHGLRWEPSSRPLKWEPSRPTANFISEWRAAHPKELAEYRGKYVAIRVRDGSVVAAGNTLGDVGERVNVDCSFDEIVYDMLPR